MKKDKCALTIIFSFFIIISVTLIIFTGICNKQVVQTLTSYDNFNKIILDAGHGGLDGGAVAIDGTEEKHLNLQITLKLKSILELCGFKVVLTRSDDNSIHDADAISIRQQKVSDIRNREKVIIENPDAIFISIHQNKFYDKNINGAQIFYSKNNKMSFVLAQKINQSVTSQIQPSNSREIKKSGTEIYLLYHSQIPSVMVECGFLSNLSDLEKIKDTDFQKKLTLAITQGIINYCKGL